MGVEFGQGHILCTVITMLLWVGDVCWMGGWVAYIPNTIFPHVMYFAIFTDFPLFFIEIFDIFENPHAKFEFPR